MNIDTSRIYIMRKQKQRWNEFRNRSTSSKTQALDQSKKVKIKPFRIRLSNLDTSSKVHWLHSLQIVRIKHKGTILQIYEKLKWNLYRCLVIHKQNDSIMEVVNLV